MASVKEESEKFLKENQTKEGIITTASGLQYEIIDDGTGEKPTAKDTVTVHYRGTLINGKEFDSSYNRNQPASFPLQNVIAGWTEGLQYMKKGAIHRLYIPADLAYGKRGAGRDIPGDAAIIFDVELLKINGK